jgi:hypothetical protein
MQMRYLFLFVLTSVFAIPNGVRGQTLQFSQVLLVNTAQTVPANKVWKVESLVLSQNFTNYSISSYFSAYLLINNSSCTVGYSSYQAGISTTLPLWLPAGTSLAAGQNISSISVIEFTVVP